MHKIKLKFNTYIKISTSDNSQNKKEVAEKIDKFIIQGILSASNYNSLFQIINVRC